MNLNEIHAQASQISKQMSSALLENEAQIEAFRVCYVSKKSELNRLFSALRDLSVQEKKEVAPLLNKLKNEALARIKSASKALSEASASSPKAADLTLPLRTRLGSRHPIQHILQRAIIHFQQLGFEVAEGPEIETDWYNFSALHFPPHHPARDMQDTFFLSRDPDMLLRTHTSSVQIRVMEQYTPPLRMIMPGRVYRNEAITARSHCFFHQIEGLYIDQEVSMIDLKHTLSYFIEQLFGEALELRFRPSYFPFTEPSAELDISCLSCKGSGCGLCKQSGWLEIAGCGMIDPQVLINCKLDPEIYSGYAFGMGIDRLTLLRYGIEDIRVLTQNDARMLQQFQTNEHLS